MPVRPIVRPSPVHQCWGLPGFVNIPITEAVSMSSCTSSRFFGDDSAAREMAHQLSFRWGEQGSSPVRSTAGRFRLEKRWVQIGLLPLLAFAAREEGSCDDCQSLVQQIGH